MKLLDWGVYVLLRLFVAWVGLMPAGLAYPFCEGLASLVYFLDRRHRRIGLINLRTAFPEQDDRWRKKVLHLSFRQIADQVVELSRISRLTPEKLGRRVFYEPGRGLQNYLQARRMGKGILYLTAHISAWELLPVAHALYGYPLSFVVRPLDNPFLDRWAARLRSRFGNRVLPKYDSLRPALKILREQGDVGLLIDQNVQEKEGVFVSFLGKTASTTSSLAALALKTSAPVLPGFIYPREKKGHYTIRFYPPLQVSRSGDFDRDLVENTARFNGYIEEMIREFPHCWLWGHRRFRTQPDGSDPYQRPT